MTPLSSAASAVTLRTSAFIGVNLPFSSTRPSVGSPCMMAQAAIRLPGSSAKERALNDHIGMANSASIGASGRTAAPSQA